MAGRKKHPTETFHSKSHAHLPSSRANPAANSTLPSSHLRPLRPAAPPETVTKLKLRDYSNRQEK